MVTLGVPTFTFWAIFVLNIYTYNGGGIPVPDLVASRHVTNDVMPRHDVVRKKIGVNRRNIYNTLQLVLAFAMLP